jgi:hypothetical protein
MKISIICLLNIFIIKFLLSQDVDILSNGKIYIQALKKLNSTYRETNLSITPDGKYLYFMSDRGGQKWSVYSGTFKGKPMYDGDIWYSEKKNGQWQTPVCLDSTINTFSGEDEPNVSPDGQTVVFQSWRYWWAYTGGPYYKTELNGKKWGHLVGLGGGITDFFIKESAKSDSFGTDGMSISPDGKTFIVACGKNYDGNLDLYISHLGIDGWTYPHKLSISTKGDERSVFIGSDNHTIYFASDAYGGFGGLDIYRAIIDDNDNCTKIENIGEPFNTKQDDYGFIITASGREAYFVRDGDIYYAKLPQDNKLSPEASILISGKIKDCRNLPLVTKIFLFDNQGKEISSSRSSSEGSYLFSIQSKSGEYSIRAENGKILAKFQVKKDEKRYEEIKIDLKYCQWRYKAGAAAESKK